MLKQFLYTVVKKNKRLVIILLYDCWEKHQNQSQSWKNTKIEHKLSTYKKIDLKKKLGTNSLSSTYSKF